MTTPSSLGKMFPRSLTLLQDRMDFLQEPLGEEFTAHITGNASRELKELPVKWLIIYGAKRNSFACQVGRRVRVVDVSIIPNVDNPLKSDARVTTEIEVALDMCNARGVMHDGCKVYLIDESSSTVVTTINAFEGRGIMSSVSLNMNILFHAPATIGTKLRIVSHSLASGNEMYSCRCEIWDTNNNRLVASGTHAMMRPSLPLQWLK